MDRRDILAGIAAVAGTPAIVSAYDQPTQVPALAVIETPHSISADTARCLEETWTHGIAGTPFEGVKVIVLSEGMKITLLGPDGVPLSRTLESD